eukprot:827135_1
MAHEVSVFGNKRHCGMAEQNTLKCQSINRIKIIVREFNAKCLHKDRSENESNLMDKFESIFITNDYTKTSLLNDFHHIKYTHNADENDDAFSKIYEYITDGIDTPCDVTQCRFVSRHYRLDRFTMKILQNEHILGDETQNNDENNPHDPRHMMDLISNIHVYFIHSYEINRLKMQELRSIHEPTDGSNLNDDSLEDMRLQILTGLIEKKRQKLGIKQDVDKYIINSVINYAEMQAILHKNSINITIPDLRSAFSAYSNSIYGKNIDALIGDLIDAYYALNDTSLPSSNGISITKKQTTKRWKGMCCITKSRDAKYDDL